jgi:ABC-type transport system involved in multi-copper enzyme maturation permease subunit
MIVLPIVERELRVAARRRGTYTVRVLVALAAILVLAGTLGFLTSRGTPSAQHGRFLFRALLVVGFTYCLLAGARATADCLSEEKREGTLGLLFLTDLKGYDVVLGKLAASSLNSIYGLVAILPVQALSLQLGGVTPGELARSALVLLNTLFFSLATGLFVSALSRDERKAMFATVFVLFLVTVAPAVCGFVLAAFVGPFSGPEQWIMGLLAFSPVFGLGYLLTDFGPAMRVPMWPFWMSVFWVHLLTWALLGLTCLILPRLWQVRAKKTRAERLQERLEQRLYGEGVQRRRFRHRLLDVNPFLWLAQRERGKPLYVWGYLAAVTGTWLWGRFSQGDVMLDRNTVVPSLLLVHSFFKVWVVSEACTRLAEDRRHGALELLLSTPLTPDQILRGQWLALRRQFLKPLLVLMVIEFLLVRQAFTTGLGLMCGVVLAADFVALGWVGQWLALTTKHLTQAMLKTLLGVLLLPWVFLFPVAWLLEESLRFRWPESLGNWSPFELRSVAWFVTGLGMDALLGWVWARRRLRRDFRLVAMDRYQPLPASGWKRWFDRAGSGVLPAQTRAT